MHPEIENLINMALADGEITEKEREVVLRKAEKLGEDKDEVEMILDGKIALMKKELVSNQHTTIKSNKEGEIKKCPACGATVPSFQTKCRDCGHEFRTNDKSLQDLINELGKIPTPINKGFWDTFSFENRKIEAANKRAELINNFPVPNYKENILEFLGQATQYFGTGNILQTVMSFNRGSLDDMFDTSKSLEKNAWKQKARQIILKARFSFTNDPKTLSLVEEYAKKIGI
jgi:ribosomal protein L40E